MCHCLLRNFFFFENAKIWVGRATLNREKKGEKIEGKKPLSSGNMYFMPVQKALFLNFKDNNCVIHVSHS